MKFLLLPILVLFLIPFTLVFAHDNDDKVTIFTDYDVLYPSFGTLVNIMIDTDRHGPMDLKITDPMGNIVTDEEIFVCYQCNQHTFYSVDLVDPFFLRGNYLIEAQMVNHGNEKDDETVRLDGTYFFSVTEPSLTEYNSTTNIPTVINTHVPSPKVIYVSHIDSTGYVIRDYMWTMPGAGGLSFTFDPQYKNIAEGPVTFSAIDNATGFVFDTRTYYYTP